MVLTVTVRMTKYSSLRSRILPAASVPVLSTSTLYSALWRENLVIMADMLTHGMGTMERISGNWGNEVFNLREDSPNICI